MRQARTESRYRFRRKSGNAAPRGECFATASCCQTHVSSTDVLDSVYTPAFRVDPRYAHYFEPTYLTDATGALAEQVADDLAQSPSGSSPTKPRSARLS